MMKRLPFFLLALLLLTACFPGKPTAAPQPTLDPTIIAIAAEATVTELARANRPATAAPKPSATAAPQIPTTPPSDFWIAYLQNHRVAVMNGEGSQSTFLTNTPGIDYLPTWSPDGKSLAFLRFDGSSHTDGILNVLALNSDTPSGIDAGSFYNYFAWMPDGKQLLATRSGQNATLEAYLLDLAAAQPVLVAKDVAEFPRLSPDGKKIALLMNTGAPCNSIGCATPNDIFVYDVASRQTTRLTSDMKPKNSITWSPDAQQIAYHLMGGDIAHPVVEIIQPDGKTVASKQTPPWWTNPWVRSPDGKQIAYHIQITEGAGGEEIYVVPSSGGASRKVTRLENSADLSAAIDTLRWRPDSSGFVFNMWIKVYTVNLDGSGLRALPISLENVLFDVRPTMDAYTPPPVPTAPASWKLCPGGLDSRLDVGRQAQVSTDPPAPNNVRSGPTKSQPLVGQIQPGEKVDILSGPDCDNGLIWWEVQSTSSGLRGFTLEGDLKTYWLVPVK